MLKMLMAIALMLSSLYSFGQSPSATNVFGSRLLQSVTVYDGYNGNENMSEKWEFSYNEAGQCVEIVNTNPYESYYTCTYSFDYVPGTVNGEAYHILMTISDKYENSPYEDDEDETYKCYLRLGENNFVEYCYEENEDRTYSYAWTFEYNSDDQLSRVTRTDDNAPDVQLATYVDGDLVKVSGRDIVIVYTSSKITNPIENTDKIMFNDDGSGFDLDELSVAYYAGLFGMPTKHLPVAYSDEDSSSTCVWEFSVDGKKTASTWQWNGEEEDYEKEVFVWSEPFSGVYLPYMDNEKTETIYSLDGIRQSKSQRGLNIINGKKVFVK